MTLRVFQGAGQTVSGSTNRLLAQLNLDDIPPAPRGTAQIEATFSLDANGVLNVSARDQGSGKEAKVQIEGSSGLNPLEVERMRKKAEAHAAETKQRIEGIDTRNEAEHAVYQMEKVLRENEGRIPDRAKASLNAAIDRAREVSKGEDAAAIKQAISELHQALHAVGRHLHSQGQTPSGAGAAAAAPSKAGRKDEDLQAAGFAVKSTACRQSDKSTPARPGH